MIRLRDMSKYYATQRGRRYVFRDVNIDIPEHKHIAVIGRNGAGKTTLLRLLGGAEFPNRGHVETRGQVSWPLGLAGGFQGSLSGLENVEFVCRIHGLNRVQTREVIDFVFDFSNIADYFFIPVKTYSSGMRARVAFGLSLAFEFDVYLVDELTSVGDMAFREKATLAFEELRERGSLVFASHSLDLLRTTCDVALVIDESRIDYFDNMEEAITRYEASIKRWRQDTRRAKKAHGTKEDVNG
jgi:capsular polysaccharide transport system ATP-binding protein